MISIIFTLLTLLAAALVPAPAAQQSVTDFQYGFCNTAVFSSTDGFAQNLNSVANSFNQNSSQFLYSLASSETGSNSDYVYGMYQCRGDVSLSDCSSCVFNAMAKFRNSSSGVALICGSLARGARVRYRGCYLRYENYNFNSDDAIDFETSPTCTGSSNESSALYQQNLGIALENSAAAAPKHALFGYNATSVGSGSANTAYVLTQCLGYVNSSRCTACLSQVSNYSNVCNRSVSGEIYFHTCFYLFSNTSFLFTYKNSPPTNSTPPSQAPTILASSPPPERTSKNNTPTIAGVVVGVCLLLAIIITLALCFLKRRSKKASKPAEIYKSQDLSEQADEQMFTQRPGTRRFSLKELQDATENFHPKNKLGEGGFGPVYQEHMKLCEGKLAYEEAHAKFLGRAKEIALPSSTMTLPAPALVQDCSLLTLSIAECSACGMGFDVSQFVGVCMLPCHHSYHLYCFGLLCRMRDATCVIPNCEQAISDIERRYFEWPPIMPSPMLKKPRRQSHECDSKAGEFTSGEAVLGGNAPIFDAAGKESQFSQGGSTHLGTRSQIQNVLDDIEKEFARADAEDKHGDCGEELNHSQVSFATSPLKGSATSRVPSTPRKGNGEKSSIGDANVAAEAKSNQENVEDDTLRDEDCVLLSFIKAGKNKKRKKGSEAGLKDARKSPRSSSKKKGDGPTATSPHGAS